MIKLRRSLDNEQKEFDPQDQQGIKDWAGEGNVSVVSQLDQSRNGDKDKAMAKFIIAARQSKMSERQIRRQVKKRFGEVLTPDIKPYVK